MRNRNDDVGEVVVNHCPTDFVFYMGRVIWRYMDVLKDDIKITLDNDLDSVEVHN